MKPERGKPFIKTFLLFLGLEVAQCSVSVLTAPCPYPLPCHCEGWVNDHLPDSFSGSAGEMLVRGTLSSTQ